MVLNKSPPPLFSHPNHQTSKLAIPDTDNPLGLSKTEIPNHAQHQPTHSPLPSSLSPMLSSPAAIDLLRRVVVRMPCDWQVGKSKLPHPTHTHTHSPTPSPHHATLRIFQNDTSKKGIPPPSWCDPFFLLVFFFGPSSRLRCWASWQLIDKSGLWTSLWRHGRPELACPGGEGKREKKRGGGGNKKHTRLRAMDLSEEDKPGRCPPCENASPSHTFHDGDGGPDSDSIARFAGSMV